MKTRRLVNRDELKVKPQDGPPVATANFTRDVRGNLLVMFTDGSWRRHVGPVPVMIPRKA